MRSEASVSAVEYDPSLPPCPVCGAAALKSPYRFAEDLSHDCECLITQEAAYYRGLKDLWKGRVESERFLA
ncbi:MAG: ATP-binding protein, partial [Meiothermus silvanus]|nr:ATP-binding protein [Allomeiothermus silvanus]